MFVVCISMVGFLEKTNRRALKDKTEGISFGSGLHGVLENQVAQNSSSVPSNKRESNTNMDTYQHGLFQIVIINKPIVRNRVKTAVAQ